MDMNRKQHGKNRLAVDARSGDIRSRSQDCGSRSVKHATVGDVRAALDSQSAANRGERPWK